MNTQITKIETKDAPAALGPYSQAISANSTGSQFVFVSGQLPINPLTGKLLEGDITALTTQVLNNIEAILKAAHCTFDDVVRVEVFMKDLNDFQLMNEEYKKRFNGPNFPARQTIQVANLPLNAAIEISCIALNKVLR